MKAFKKAAPVALLALVMIITGCKGFFGGTSSNDTGLTIHVSDATGVITGQLIDNSTKAGIGGATVSIVVNGAKMTTTTSTDTDADLTGTFSINGVPAGVYTVKFMANGYAVRLVKATVPVSNDNTPNSVNMGMIALAPGITLTVVTTDKGTPVAGVTVAAMGNGGGTDMDLITAVSDTNGKAALNNLDLNDTYLVCATPTYSAGSGTAPNAIKYLAACISGSDPSGNIYDPKNSDRTASIALLTPTRNDAITSIADNLIHVDTTFNLVTRVFGGADFTSLTGVNRVAKQAQNIVYVYNYPVSISGDVTTEYINSYVTNSTSLDPATGYGKTIVVSTATAALDSSGTILTISNSAGWTANQFYMLRGAVTALEQNTNNPTGVNLLTANSIINNTIYVNDSANVLSANTTLVADNYNGTTAPITSGPSQVYVNFPVYVYGTYRVISTGTNTSLQVNTGDGETALTASNAMLYANNSTGVDAKPVFRVGINSGGGGLVMSNNTTTNPNSFVAHFDVRDAEGNAFSKTVTLTIQ